MNRYRNILKKVTLKKNIEMIEKLTPFNLKLSGIVDILKVLI
jgi:hypothetical protein